MRRKIRSTGCYSWCIGSLPKGCQLCVKGRKLVLLATGLCSRKCFYCPLSEQKNSRDVVYANEMPLKDTDDVKSIIKEAEMCSAQGAGITGGDPLVRLERTVKFIKALKKHFGKSFHIHLYTLPELFNYNAAKKLYKAGLDEIRFHPDLTDNKHWERIKNAVKFDWDVGMEIPVIPGYEKQTMWLIDYMSQYIKFLNLNELEYSDTNASNLIKLGFRTKGSLSYGIKGSEKLALKILERLKGRKYKFKVHYCTAKLKDAVQLKNRIKLRAKNAAEKFDIVTDEGVLVRGAIYTEESFPGKDKKTKFSIDKLISLQKELSKIAGKDMFMMDAERGRILTNAGIVEHNKERIKKKGLIPAIVHEYPTYDKLIVELERL